MSDENGDVTKSKIDEGNLAVFLVGTYAHHFIILQRSSIFDELYSIQNLLEIQQLFYFFLYRSVSYHLVQETVINFRR